MSEHRPLSKVQKTVLTLAFVPMLATGVAGGIGTYTNISAKYGAGTATGAVAAGEGATAVLALVLLGLTMLGQSSPTVIRIGLWALPAAASAMAATAAKDPGQIAIYAITPMGMTVAAEGIAFLARRIVVHQDGRDAEAETRAAAVVRELAYHRARAANHPDKKTRKGSERRSWKLARKVGAGDASLGTQLLDIQRDRVTSGADSALHGMFSVTSTLDRQPPQKAEESVEIVRNRSTADLEESTPGPVAPVSTPAPLQLPAPVDPLKQVDALKPMKTVTPVEPVKAPPDRVAAAESTRPRRATGVVPDAARSPRPKRTPAELLDEARTLTADWSDAELTAEGIRKALHTSAQKARGLRDTLRAERNDEQEWRHE